VKTRKHLDRRSEDVETQRTCQGGLEFFHLFFEKDRFGRFAGKRLKRYD